MSSHWAGSAFSPAWQNSWRTSCWGEGAARSESMSAITAVVSSGGTDISPSPPAATGEDNPDPDHSTVVNERTLP